MKMRILGLTLMAFFLFSSAAFAAGKVDKDHGAMVSSFAKVSKSAMNTVANPNSPGFTGGSGDGDGDSTSGDGDSDSTVDDVTGDLMDGFF